MNAETIAMLAKPFLSALAKNPETHERIKFVYEQVDKFDTRLVEIEKQLAYQTRLLEELRDAVRVARLADFTARQERNGHDIAEPN